MTLAALISALTDASSLFGVLVVVGLSLTCVDLIISSVRGALR